MKKLNEWINRKETGINRELFKKNFIFQKHSDMLKALYTTNDKKKNADIENVTKSGLSDLKEEIEYKCEEEKEIEKPNEVVDIVKNIVEFNKQNQTGVGLKIVTPNQMLSRLPISLAQFKAGNNSQKLKNKIKQLLYSLYHSKKLTKQLYESLVDII